MLTTGLAWVATLPARPVADRAVGDRRPGGVRTRLPGGHNPLDVAGGFGLGLAIGGAVNLALGVPAEGPDAGRLRAGAEA